MPGTAATAAAFKPTFASSSRNRHDLLFCAHHYRQHEPALAKVAVAIQDETQRLTRGERSGSPG
jgi:hypothetical protein